MVKRDRRGLHGALWLVVGVLIGSILIAPAGAHLTKRLTHLFGHTDARYYKKTLSEARYINVGEKASDAVHADVADNASDAVHADVADNASDAVHADVADNATTADDSNTLDGIDSSGFFSVGRSSSNSLCDPQSTTLISCTSTSVTLPLSARVLVIVDANWNANGAAPARGACQIYIDGTPQPGTAIRAGESATTTDTVGYYQHAGSTYVSDVLAAGAHSFAFLCNELDSNIEFRNVMISAVTLGAG